MLTRQKANVAPFTIAVQVFERLFILVDGIYPSYSHTRMHAEGHPGICYLITDSTRWSDLDNREEYTRLLNALIEHKKEFKPRDV
jgi:hypothetical protein